MFPTENRGFEPLVVLSTQTFQVCTISLSDNSPGLKVGGFEPPLPDERIELSMPSHPSPDALSTEVVGFEPTVPITWHGILAGFCNKPLCHTSNVILKQPIRVLCCSKATIGTTRLELVTARLSAVCSTNWATFHYMESRCKCRFKIYGLHTFHFFK